MNKIFKRLLLIMCFSLSFVIPNSTLSITANDNSYSGIKGKYTDYILYGFDMVKAPMPDSTQIKKKPILDKEKLTNQKADNWYDCKPGNRKFKIATIIEKNSYELNNSVAQQLKLGYKTPEIGFSSNFGWSSSSEVKNNSYHGVLLANALYEQEALALNTYSLEAYLSEGFVDAVKTGNYKYVFEKYGTHLVEDASVGAQLNIVFDSKESSTLSKNEIQACLEGSYYNMTGDCSTTASTSISKLKENITYHIDGNGGNVVLPNDFSQTATYNNWINSLNENNLAMYQVNECIPIWELFSDPTIQKNLQIAYYNYFNEHLKELRDNFPFITNIRSMEGIPSEVSQRLSTNEYIVGNTASGTFQYTNLDESLPRQFRYLLYKTGTNKSQKINELILQSSYDQITQPESGYTHLQEIIPERYQQLDYVFVAYRKKLPRTYLHYNCNSSDSITGFQALCTREYSDSLDDNWVLIKTKDGTPLNLMENLENHKAYLFGYVDPVLIQINTLITENDKKLLTLSKVATTTNAVSTKSTTEKTTSGKTTSGGGGGRANLGLYEKISREFSLEYCY